LGFADSIGIPVRYVTVGEKGRDLMWRLGKKVVAEFHDTPVVPDLVDVSPIARTAIDEFLAGHISEIYLAYTDFVNMLTQNPVIQPLLPLCQPQVGDQTPMTCVLDLQPAQITEYIYEPDAPTILDEILPRFIELQVYQAILEGHASEHAARMVAMRNATENAEELVRDLTLDYNKARQRSITREILDIVGGAEALEQQHAAAAR
jgi:F-type H+-transporting ATPase subunit gamma